MWRNKAVIGAYLAADAPADRWFCPRAFNVLAACSRSTKFLNCFILYLSGIRKVTEETEAAFLSLKEPFPLHLPKFRR